MTEYSRQLAEFVADFSEGDIPDAVWTRCRQSITNGIAAALSASGVEPVEMLIAVLSADAEAGRAHLIGRSERLNLLDAALVNGYMGHYNDYDDTHLETTYHTNSMNVPAALNLGAARHFDGRRALVGLALGMEASIRLGQALGRVHYDAGWHTTGTLGAVGVALTGARMLGLDATQTNHALGLSLTQAAGLRGLMFGSMAKGLNSAKAAHNGLLSALLAERGFTAAPNAIEGPRGYASAASSPPGTVRPLDGELVELSPRQGVALGRLTEGLGSRWEVEAIGFKPYASGVATHATIDAVLGLRAELGLHEGSTPDEVRAAVSRIEQLVLTIPARSLRLPRQRAIETPLEAKFSMYNVAAIVLVRGRAGPGEYNEAALIDPSILAVRELVELRGDDAMPQGAGALDARLSDGRRISIIVDHALGTKERPLDEVALRRKLFDAATGILPREQTEELSERLEAVDDLADVGELLELCVRRPQTTA